VFSFEEDIKMKKWKVVVAVVVIALFCAWYAFRPEGLFIDRRVQEELPTANGGASLQPVASGSFHSVVHPTEGTATIYEMPDGTRVLRFTSFRTTNGPNVHVYMVAADDAKDNTTVRQAGFIDLGHIKGNVGDQNYFFGPDVDLSKYRAVSVWCKRFSLNFGAAPLVPGHVASRD
jgi:Electron transfer DM13